MRHVIIILIDSFGRLRIDKNAPRSAWGKIRTMALILDETAQGRAYFDRNQPSCLRRASRAELATGGDEHMHDMMTGADEVTPSRGVESLRQTGGNDLMNCYRPRTEALNAAYQRPDAVTRAQSPNARRRGHFDEDGLLFARITARERQPATRRERRRQERIAPLRGRATTVPACCDARSCRIWCGRGCAACCPGIELHATRRCGAQPQGVRFLRLHGYDRAVLAREMPLREIAECAEEGVDIEAFGHGALCGACSGQCLFSSMVGGRSGNRGMCAQPCRLPYRLGEKAGYLLSPKDLMTLRHLPDLQRAA